MNMRKALLLLLLALPLYVSAAEGSQLVVWLKTGGKVSYALSEAPVTTFSGTKLTISTNKVIVSYDRKNVLRYTYELVEETGINLAPNDRQVQVNREGSEVVFRGLPAGATASVYASNGMLIDQYKASGSEPLTISLQHRPDGVYIIKAGTETIKLMKQ